MPHYYCLMPMKTYDSIIFDIDGTLWDARHSITRAWNIAIGELTGTPGRLDTDGFSSQFGKTMDELYAYVFPEMDVEKRREWGAYCVQRENEVLMEAPGDLYPAVRETLETLGEKYPLYIVSNCGAGYIEAMLHGTGLEKFFCGWMCYADTQAPKNVTLRVLAERYGLAAPVYVGDIQGDADACKKAGLPIIYASYGLGTINEGDYIAKINTFSDLLEVLL